MKNWFLIPCFVVIASCSSGTKGVGLSFIREQFNLPDTTPLTIQISDNDSCPKIEFGSEASFFIRFEENNPVNSQSEFTYEEDEFKQMGDMRILRGKNQSGSAFEFTFDNEVTYTLTIDYNCPTVTEDCVNTTFSCSGPIQ